MDDLKSAKRSKSDVGHPSSMADFFKTETEPVSLGRHLRDLDTAVDAQGGPTDFTTAEVNRIEHRLL